MSGEKIYTGAEAMELRTEGERFNCEDSSKVAECAGLFDAMMRLRDAAPDLAASVAHWEALAQRAEEALREAQEKAARHCGAMVDIAWQGGKAEAGEALDAMRERTERNEAALRVVALWLGGPHQSSQAADVEALARAKGAELDALRAIIEGRTTPPTREEAEAHFAGGGSFRVRFDDGTSLECFEPSHLRMARRASMTSHWWALDSTGRPCALVTEAPDAR